MWILFAVISLTCYALSDLLGKKHTDSSDSLAVVKLLASANAMAFIAGVAMYALGFGESGQAPWQLLYGHPIILLPVSCFVVHWLFFLLSMYYIGLSMDEAVQSTFGVFYFVGLILVNIFTGKLSEIGEMLQPLRLIPIILVIVFTVLMPNVEVIIQRKSGKPLEKAKDERKNIIIGLILLLVSTVFDSVDSLVATVILEDGSIGVIDYMQASYFAYIIPSVLFSIFIILKSKKRFIPFVSCGKYTVVYSFAAMLSSVFYLISCSYDAIRTGILFIAFPIVPILGAKLFLKEKYSKWQNVCIWVITISSILFCVSEYLM